MRNFAHPAIKALVLEFFYNSRTRSDALATLFKDDFQEAVPEEVMALAATAVCFSLGPFLKVVNIRIRSTMLSKSIRQVFITIFHLK